MSRGSLGVWLTDCGPSRWARQVVRRPVTPPPAATSDEEDENEGDDGDVGQAEEDEEEEEEEEEAAASASEDAEGRRRSDRNRVAPVQFWENEHPVYKPRKSGGVCSCPAHVTSPLPAIVSLTLRHRSGVGRCDLGGRQPAVGARDQARAQAPRQARGQARASRPQRRRGFVVVVVVSVSVPLGRQDAGNPRAQPDGVPPHRRRHGDGRR